MYTVKKILVAGIVLAILGDYLLRATPGINAFLWVAAFLLCTATITRISPLHSMLAVPTLFFAGCIAWRDADFLIVANGLAVGGLLTLPFVQRSRVVLRLGYLMDYMRGLSSALVGLWGNTSKFLRVELPETFRGHRTMARIRPLVIGISSAIPVAAVFLLLFSSADPAFGRATRSLVELNPSNVVSHFLMASTIALGSFGYLYGLSKPFERVAGTSQDRPRVGMVEVGIPLGVLIAIVATFIAFQVPYLFGGLGRVHDTPGLSYATYARRGFFELTTASALVVPILLTSDWVLDKHARHRRLFNLMTVTLLALVGILMLSALQRMALYWDRFGLTTTRVYATSFMAWVGSVLAWLALTVLRNRRRRFAFGCIVSGLVMLAGLNFANPEALIVRMNFARGADRFDWQYASRLSADATNAILHSLPSAPDHELCAIATVLTRSREEPAGDWRSWNVSRHFARESAQRMAQIFRDACYARPEA